MPEKKTAQSSTSVLEPKIEKPVAEKQTNCLSCNKPLKKLKHYYRNGKFYCTKKCWYKVVKPKAEAKEAKK